MKTLIRTYALAATLLIGGSAFAAPQVSFGIRIGPPPRTRVVQVPPRPGLDYTWVDGYWYPVGNRYVWHGGYWTRPPYAGARWVAPRYYGNQYYNGYWQGNNGRFDHDHRWDRDNRNRDWQRYRDNNRR